MKKFIPTLIAVIVVQMAFSQNKYLDYKVGFKVYNALSYTRQVKTYTTALPDGQFVNYSLKEENWSFLNPSIAVQWKNKRNDFHEIEMSNLAVNSRTNKTGNYIPAMGNPSNLLHSSIHLRYEYILNFIKNKESRIVPGIGFGINPYFGFTKNSPLVANEFASKEAVVGSRFCVSPRLVVHVSSRFYAELNIPVGILDTRYVYTYDSNPSVPVEGRRANRFNFDAFPAQFNARIGVGVKI